MQDLSNNQLDQLPGGVGFLVRMVEMSLHHNHLQELPNDFVNMRSKCIK